MDSITDHQLYVTKVSHNIYNIFLQPTFIVDIGDYKQALAETRQAPAKVATTTMKGLLRGLRYITHIFEDKEQEMQIGFPTDVKHVAHIGMDGPSTNSPSWMTGFKSVPELANEPSNSSTNGPLRNSAKYAVEDVTRKAAAEVEDSQTRTANEKAKHKARRKTSAGNGSPTSSPTRQAGTEGSKQRRHTSSKDATNNEKSNLGGAEKSNIAAESSSNDSGSLSKQTRRKKTKGSTSGGATKEKVGKSKGHNSSSDTIPSTDNESGFELGQGTKNDSLLSPISETKQEEKG